MRVMTATSTGTRATAGKNIITAIGITCRNRHGRRIRVEVRFPRNRSIHRDGPGRPETIGRHHLPGDRITGEAVSITAPDKANSKAADSLRALSNGFRANEDASKVAIGNLVVVEDDSSAAEGAGAAENLAAVSEEALAEAEVSVAKGVKL
jgi:hypothetical protein